MLPFANSKLHTVRRIFAATVVLVGLSGTLIAYAASTDLADLPIGGLMVIPSNLFLTQDRSGSMDETTGYTYDKTQLYRPWLYDGVALPPHGPVRFENATFTSACHNGLTAASGPLVWANGYASGGGSTTDYIIAGCTSRIDLGAKAGLAVCADTSCVTVPKVSSKPAGTTAAPNRTDCAVSSCSDAAEQQNIANWYQYYRTRLLTSRAASGEAIGRQSYATRVGYMYYSSSGAKLYDITVIDGRDSTGSLGAGSRRYLFARDELFNKIDADSGTPTRSALLSVGEYFKTDAPYRDDPAVSGSPLRSCRRNINVIMTDGRWNTGCSPLFATIGNADTNIAPPATTTASVKQAPGGQMIFASPFKDAWGNATAVASGGACTLSSTMDNRGPTLADIAWYYWATDLRTDLKNNVPVTNRDPNPQQHLTNYTIFVQGALEGSVSLASINSVFSALDNVSNATSPYPTVPTIAWPNPMDLEDQERTDDLAHAAVNSRGGYFWAKDKDSLTAALVDAFSDKVSNGAAAAVALNNPTLNAAGGNWAYLATFDPSNWTGQLNSYKVDPLTGDVDLTTKRWSSPAEQQLDTLYHVSTTSSSGGHNNRIVVTYAGGLGGPKAGRGIAFRPTASRTDGTALQSLFFLNSAATDGADVIEYLRGNSIKEGLGDDKYRDRPGMADTIPKAGLLGDIVDSTPLLIPAPNRAYRDGIDPGYSSFKTTEAKRASLLALGANDGMVHFFDEATGAEKWNYVPSFSFDCSLAGPGCIASSGASLANPMRDRARSLGFAHKYLVDGRMQHQDVDFSRTLGSTASSSDWHTIVVGGLGKGGRGIYALDVSGDPPVNESDAQSRVLWEFPYYSTFTSSSKIAVPEAKNLGYTHAWIHTVKVKINEDGVTNGKWVVLLPSGFNNGGETGGDGKGRLFVLNARTGELIREIATPVGTSDSPSGLSQISAWVDDQNTDKTSDTVYGGDLLGNLWRFDLSDTDPKKWSVSLISTLVSPDGKPQPITTAPELTVLSGKRWVFVGTGKYLGATDRPGAPGASTEQAAQAIQTQSLWGLPDPGKDVTISSIRSKIVEFALTGTSATAGVERVASSSTGGSTSTGWVVDLGTRERINVDPQIGLNVLVAATNSPAEDICDTEGTGSLLFFNLNSLASGSLGSTGFTAGYSLGTITIGGLSLAKTTDGSIKVEGTISNELTLKASGIRCEGHICVMDAGGEGAGRVAKRFYWRELPAQ